MLNLILKLAFFIRMPTAKQLKRIHHIKSLPRYILKTLLTTGVIVIASQSPYFAISVIKYFRDNGFSLKNDRATRRKFSNTFNRLEKQGYIQYKQKGKQVYIRLTEEGKKKAGYYQIDNLEVAQQKKWDKKWRIIAFDIPESVKMKRDILRGKLKELGFTQLQKSIWVHAYPCKDELSLLKDFFGFKDGHYIFIEASYIESCDLNLKGFFNIK